MNKETKLSLEKVANGCLLSQNVFTQWSFKFAYAGEVCLSVLVPSPWKGVSLMIFRFESWFLSYSSRSFFSSRTKFWSILGASPFSLHIVPFVFPLFTRSSSSIFFAIEKRSLLYLREVIIASLFFDVRTFSFGMSDCRWEEYLTLHILTTSEERLDNRIGEVVFFWCNRMASANNWGCGLFFSLSVSLSLYFFLSLSLTLSLRDCVAEVKPDT